MNGPPGTAAGRLVRREEVMRSLSSIRSGAQRLKKKAADEEVRRLAELLADLTAHVEDVERTAQRAESKAKRAGRA